MTIVNRCVCFAKSVFLIDNDYEKLAKDGKIADAVAGTPLVLGGGAQTIKRLAQVQRLTDVKRQRAAEDDLEEEDDNQFAELGSGLYDMITFRDSKQNHDCVVILFTVVMNMSMSAQVIEDG